MMDKAVLEKVDAILRNAQGHALDISLTLYSEYIAPSKEPETVLQCILQYGAQVGTADAPPERVSDETINRVGRIYYNLLHEMVCALMRENLSVELFYKNLYEQVFASRWFPVKDEERAVLLWILIEKIPELPYFQADGLLKQTNEEYQESFERVWPQVMQAVHMINRRFDTRTEEASQLVRIAGEIKDETDRVVYWSALLGALKSMVRNGMG